MKGCDNSKIHLSTSLEICPYEIELKCMGLLPEIWSRNIWRD